MKNYFMRICLICPFLLCVLAALVWILGRNGVTERKVYYVKTSSHLFPNETWKLRVPVVRINFTTLNPTTLLDESEASRNITRVSNTNSNSFLSYGPSSPVRPTKLPFNDNVNSTTTATPPITTATSISPVIAHKRHRYIIEWLHWEQMTMAVQSLIQLAWFTASWEARVVEPFTHNSYFHGLVNRDHSYHSMSAIFDMDKFNEILLRHSIPPLATFSEFVDHGSKKILVIHVFFGDNDSKAFSSVKANRSVVFDMFRKENSSVVRCDEAGYMKVIGSSLVHTINYALSLKQARQYKIVGSCCINGFDRISRGIVREKCGIPDLDEDHTIVVTDWRGISSKLNFRLFSPELQSANIPRETVYPYNQKVEKHAADFLRSFANGNPVLFIHFRSEKLAAMELTVKDYFDNCVKKALEIKEMVLSKNMSQTYVVACVTDVSKHGSRTCRKRSCPGRNLMDIAVKKYKLNTVSYDPLKFNGMFDSTFVAAVEQVALSMADVLILVGGGSFQNQLKLRYISNHDTRRNSGLHQICN